MDSDAETECAPATPNAKLYFPKKGAKRTKNLFRDWISNQEFPALRRSRKGRCEYRACQGRPVPGKHLIATLGRKLENWTNHVRDLQTSIKVPCPMATEWRSFSYILVGDTRKGDGPVIGCMIAIFDPPPHELEVGYAILIPE